MCVQASLGSNATLQDASVAQAEHRVLATRKYREAAEQALEERVVAVEKSIAHHKALAALSDHAQNVARSASVDFAKLAAKSSASDVCRFEMQFGWPNLQGKIHPEENRPQVPPRTPAFGTFSQEADAPVLLRAHVGTLDVSPQLQGASRSIAERLQSLKARLHRLVDRVLDKHQHAAETRHMAERCRQELHAGRQELHEAAEAKTHRQEEEAWKLSKAMEETRTLASKLHASEERLGDETAWVLAMAEAGLEAERAMRATRLKQVESELHHAEAVYARIEAKNEIARTKLRVRSLIEASRGELQDWSSLQEQSVLEAHTTSSNAADDLARALEVVATNRKRQEMLSAVRKETMSSWPENVRVGAQTIVKSSWF